MQSLAPANLIKKYVQLFSLFFLLFGACSKDASISENTDLGYKYYPMDVGTYLIYNIDSIVFNDFTGGVDTFNYQLMELIESEFSDNEGRLAHRIERFKRTDTSSAWQIHNVFQATKTEKRVERVENNVKYIRMIFPVRENLKWDGNAFNTEEEWKYTYKKVNKNYLLGVIPFDSTVTVIQKDEFNLIESQYYEEVYAANLGLIYKKVDDLKTEINGKIKSGVKYKQQFFSNGKL